MMPVSGLCGSDTSWGPRFRERTLGDGFELGRKHTKAHEPPTNFPSFVGGPVHGMYDLCGSVVSNTRGELHENADLQPSSLSTARASWRPGVRAYCVLLGQVSRSSNLLWQSMRDNTTGTRIPIWSERLVRYPGNLRRGRFLRKVETIPTNVSTTGVKWSCSCLATPVRPVRRDGSEVDMERTG